MSSRLHAHRALAVSLALYALATIVHFVHNAELLAQYPNMPTSWSRLDIYFAWAMMSAVGISGWLLFRSGRRRSGLVLLAVYAAFGLDSLGHYALAPWDAHTAGMNTTILLEVGCAMAVLLAVVLQFISRRTEPRQYGRDQA